MAEKLRPEEIAQKQASRLKAATADIERGVNRVNTAPGEKAAQKADKMLTNLRAAVESGKWSDRVAAVPLEEWKAKTIRKGIPRIAQGIDEAVPKMTEFHNQRQGHQGRIDQELDSMPDTTLEDGINRAIHQMRRMSEFRFQR